MPRKVSILQTLNHSELRGLARNPEWTRASGIRDWRIYVPHEVRSWWADMSTEARAAVYLTALAAAKKAWIV